MPQDLPSPVEDFLPPPGFFGPSSKQIYEALELVYAKLHDLEVRVCGVHNEVLRLEASMAQANEAIFGKLDQLLFKQTAPGPLKIFVTEELDMDTLKFYVQLPAEPENTDIVSGELNVVVAGTPLSPIATIKNQGQVEGLEGKQGDSVELSFAYLDDADPPNKSGATTLSTTLQDTIAPPVPGALGIVVTAEEVDDSPEPPAEEPPAEEPPAEEPPAEEPPSEG